MVVEHIGHDRGIMPEQGTQALFALGNHRVAIGIFVDGAVQFYACSNVLFKPAPHLPAFDKVAYEIAYHYPWTIAGQVQMCKKVHRQNYAFAEHTTIVIKQT